MSQNSPKIGKSPSKKNQQSAPLAYNFLKDPHLIYYLQSPVRVTQLLESGLYQLDGSNLVELETLESLAIAEYVLEKIPL